MTQPDALLADQLVALMRGTTALGRAVSERHGLSLHQSIALDVVRRRTQRPMALLTSELEISLSAGTKLVDRLAGLGYVERQPHPTDRRVHLLALTPTGEALAAAIQADWEAVMRRWQEAMPDPVALTAAFTQIVAAMPPAD